MRGGLTRCIIVSSTLKPRLARLVRITICAYLRTPPISSSPMSLHNQARVEFLTDEAFYFKDKKEMYLDIKDHIGKALEVPRSMVRICGSAYWGKRYASGDAFAPGESDLDVALISERLFVQIISEVRAKTHNFTNLTFFSGQEAPGIFQDYALKKGIVRLDVTPRTDTMLKVTTMSANLSKKYLNHFSSINLSVYDTEMSFSNKQVGALEKFTRV